MNNPLSAIGNSQFKMLFFFAGGYMITFIGILNASSKYFYVYLIAGAFVMFGGLLFNWLYSFTKTAALPHAVLIRKPDNDELDIFYNAPSKSILQEEGKFFTIYDSWTGKIEKVQQFYTELDLPLATDFGEKWGIQRKVGFFHFRTWDKVVKVGMRGQAWYAGFMVGNGNTDFLYVYEYEAASGHESGNDFPMFRIMLGGMEYERASLLPGVEGSQLVTR